MSVLARYRKPGGFRQLLLLIETSQPVKQEKLLEVVAKEDPDWAELLRQKKIDAEMILSWDPSHLVVVFEHMNERHCAAIFKHIGVELIKDYSNLFREEKYRDLKNEVDDGRDPTDAEVRAAHNHMIETVRYLDEEKKLNLRFINPELDMSDAA